MGAYVDIQVLQLIKESRNLESQLAFKKAKKKFEQAWSLSNTDFEKYMTARLLAQTHAPCSEQLEWLLLSLDFGMKVYDNAVKISLPTLYYEIGVCYEDLKDYINAKANYRMGQNYIDFIPEGGEKKQIIKTIQKSLDKLDKRGR